MRNPVRKILKMIHGFSDQNQEAKNNKENNNSIRAVSASKNSKNSLDSSWAFWSQKNCYKKCLGSSDQVRNPVRKF